MSATTTTTSSARTNLSLYSSRIVFVDVHLITIFVFVIGLLIRPLELASEALLRDVLALESCHVRADTRLLSMVRRVDFHRPFIIAILA